MPTNEELLIEVHKSNADLNERLGKIDKRIEHILNQIREIQGRLTQIALGPDNEKIDFETEPWRIKG